MNYLLDTCTISDFFKKTASVIERFEKISPSQIHISTVTLMELEYGLQLNVERAKKIEPLWRKLSQYIKLVPYTFACACATASIRAQLKKTGQPIGPYDILIAGTALANDFTVVTSNFNEFSRVPELLVEDWKK